MMFMEGMLGVLAASSAVIAVKTITSEYWAWRNRRDLQAKRILDALGDDGQKQSVYNQMLKDLSSQYAGKPMLTQPVIYPLAGSGATGGFVSQPTTTTETDWAHGVSTRQGRPL